MKIEAQNMTNAFIFGLGFGFLAGILLGIVMLIVSG